MTSSCETGPRSPCRLSLSFEPIMYMIVKNNKPVHWECYKWWENKQANWNGNVVIMAKFHQWLHRKLSKCQLSEQLIIKIMSEWQHSPFSACSIRFHLQYQTISTLCVFNIPSIQVGPLPINPLSIGSNLGYFLGCLPQKVRVFSVA